MILGYEVGDLKILPGTEPGTVRVVGLSRPTPIRVRVVAPRFAASAWTLVDPGVKHAQPITVVDSVDLRVRLITQESIRAPASFNLHRPGPPASSSSTSASGSSRPIPRSCRHRRRWWEPRSTSRRRRPRQEGAHGRRRRRPRGEDRTHPPGRAPRGTIRISVRRPAGTCDRGSCATTSRFGGRALPRSCAAARRVASCSREVAIGRWEVLGKIDKKCGSRRIGRSNSRDPAESSTTSTSPTARSPRVTVDLPDVTPGSIAGTALHDNQPLRNRWIYARSSDHAWVQRFWTDEHGASTAVRYHRRPTASSPPGSRSSA